MVMPLSDSEMPGAAMASELSRFMHRIVRMIMIQIFLSHGFHRLNSTSVLLLVLVKLPELLNALLKASGYMPLISILLPVQIDILCIGAFTFLDKPE